MNEGFRAGLISLDLSATGASEPIDLVGVLSVDIILDGALGDHDGALKVQKSNDRSIWRDVTLFNKATGAAEASVAISPGAAIDTDREVSIAARWIRFYYTRSAGGAAQTCSIAVHSKKAGALASISSLVLSAISALLTLINAKLPAIGPQPAGSSMSVTPDSAWRLVLNPTLGTVVYLTISGASADSGALAAGTYLLTCDVACWYRVNAATAGAAAVAKTAPARLLLVGDSAQVVVGASGAIVAITTGGTGVLGYQLVS